MTDIVEIRRVRSKAILRLSDGETRQIPRALLRGSGFRPGMPFSEAAFQSLLAERGFPCACRKAAGLLALRSYSASGLAKTLQNAGYPETIIARTIAFFQEEGILDDERYAERFAQSRAARGVGARRLRAELQRKGIDREMAEAAVARLQEEDADVLDAALAKAAQKAAAHRDLSDRRQRENAIAALIRRGYGFTEAREAIQSIIDET